MSPAPPAIPSLPRATTQVIRVYGEPGSSHATVATLVRVGDDWRAALPPMPARIGELGFSDEHVEGVPSTPIGVYPIGDTMFGIEPDPGVRYPYHRVVEGDHWDSNSDSPTYNTFVPGRDPGAGSEALWRFHPAYRHFAVIGYNMPAVPGKGSAIFLHEGTGGPTAGCVSLGRDDLVAVLTWLDPTASPRIVLGPVD
ncbi:MAG TPA: L,D-transpeptidase family protein [Micromonosporaceae bacterium]